MEVFVFYLKAKIRFLTVIIILRFERNKFLTLPLNTQQVSQNGGMNLNRKCYQSEISPLSWAGGKHL